MNTVALKRPTGVYILAVLFMLAPIGNLAISFAGSGVADWYSLDVMVPFLKSVPIFEWVWLGLLFVTGILLFFPHKLSWSIAIGTLVLVLLINSVRLFSGEIQSIDPNFLKIFSILAMLCTLGVLVIAVYFRFPYLDRRDNWFTKEKRHNIKTIVKIGEYSGNTISVSKSGCLVSSEGVSNNFKVGERIQFQIPQATNKTVTAVVVESSAKDFRLEFRGASSDFSRELSEWLSRH